MYHDNNEGGGYVGDGDDGDDGDGSGTCNGENCGWWRLKSA